MMRSSVTRLAAVAGGTVQFKDGGTNIGGPVTIVNGTAAVSYIFTTSGARDITAVYSGGDSYNDSTSTSQTVTVSGTGGTGGTGGAGSLKNIFGS
ncbi:Ig-like domain-containing protein [Jongsikchunia kroppenstedtii]|uniref:Ig-like domain-containing protein n=1 Tax=Jongsikchunia kroppenstedtii TaxID=1121721 RepID=UPI00037B4BB6